METTQGDVSREKQTERKPSKLYAMKQFAEASNKLNKLGMISDTEREQLVSIVGRLTDKYIGFKF